MFGVTKRKEKGGKGKTENKHTEIKYLFGVVGEKLKVSWGKLFAFSLSFAVKESTLPARNHAFKQRSYQTLIITAVT